MCHNVIGIKLFQIWPKKYSSFFNMLMRYQPIINKRKKNYCNRARLSFLGIGNKTFPLNSSDRSWTVADSKIQFFAYRFKLLPVLLSRSLLS